MAELKYICISFSLTLLVSFAVGSHNMDMEKKLYVGSQFGYEGGFCLPGMCINGAGGSRVNFGMDHYHGGGIPYNADHIRDRYGYRETLYCKPVTCWGGSCDALHLHIDKGMYESLVSKKATKNPSGIVDFIPETFKYNVNNDYDMKEVKEVAMAPQSN